MLTALHLGNFKAFGAPVRIPIRPITLIFGPNSAGKSSLIHGLVLGDESLRKKSFDITRTKLGGDSIDLGGFRHYVHRRALAQRVTWGVEIQAGKDLTDLFFGEDRFVMLASFGFPLDDEDRPLSHAKLALASYQLEFSRGSRLRMSRRPDGHLRIDELSSPLVKFMQRFRSSLSSSSSNGTTWSQEDLGKAMLAATAKSHRLDLELTHDKSEQDEVSNTLDDVLAHVNHHVAIELGRLSYLGPLRSYPPRHTAFSEHDDANWIAGGGRAWDRMRKSKKLRDAVNAWLGAEDRLQTRYRIALQQLIAPQTAQNAIGAALDEIHARLSTVRGPGDEQADAREVVGADDEEVEHDVDDAPEKPSPLEQWDRDDFVKIITRGLVRDRDVEGDADLVLIDVGKKTTVSHRDVGIGISQVLPVLVEAYGNEGRLVAIEQPEIHLHPRLQAELADVFLESALGPRKNTFILETHSEHLILRILRRIRETTEKRLPEGMHGVRPEDVAVLSVVPDAAGSRVVEIPLTEDGEFGAPWPGGFFPERLKELY